MSRTVARLLAGAVLIASVVVPATITTPSAQAACRPVLTSFTLARTTLTGGQSTAATIKLSCRVSTRQKIRLAATTGIKVPDYVYVAKGTSTRKVTVRTSPTTKRVAGTVKATYRLRAIKRSLTRTITPCYPTAVPSSVSIPTYVHAGSSATGTVTLDCYAKTSLGVSLTSSNSGVTVPATITVSAGKRTASFKLATKLPATGSQAAYNATIRATRGQKSVSRAIQVRPGLRTVSAVQAADSNAVNVTIGLSGPATTETVVSLIAATDYVDGAPVLSNSLSLPSKVTIPAGRSASVITAQTNVLNYDEKVIVKASLAGRAVSTQLTTLRAFRAGDSYTVHEPTLAPSGTDGEVRGELRVTLDHPAGPDGATVEFRGQRSYVPAGSMTARVAVYANPYPADSLISGTLVIENGESSGILVHQDASYAVHPAPSELRVPTPVITGRPATATVKLVGPSAQSETIHLTGTGVTVPATVTVPAGATSATFQIDGTGAGTGSVRAELRGATTSTSVTVGAAIPDECQPQSIDVFEDVYVTNDFYDPLAYQTTVALGCVAPTDLLIPLGSSNSYALSTPRFVEVTKGSTTGTFALEAIGGGACYYFRCVDELAVEIQAGPIDLSTSRTIAVKPGLWSFFYPRNATTGQHDLEIWMTGRASTGTIVHIATDRPDLLAFPESIVVPAGSRFITVPAVSSDPSAAGSTVRITVSIGRGSQTHEVVLGN